LHGHGQDSYFDDHDAFIVDHCKDIGMINDNQNEYEQGQVYKSSASFIKQKPVNRASSCISPSSSSELQPMSIAASAIGP
jgi:hypothetical protein